MFTLFAESIFFTESSNQHEEHFSAWVKEFIFVKCFVCPWCFNSFSFHLRMNLVLFFKKTENRRILKLYTLFFKVGLGALLFIWNQAQRTILHFYISYKRDRKCPMKTSDRDFKRRTFSGYGIWSYTLLSDWKGNISQPASPFNHDWPLIFTYWPLRDT